jgi:cobalt-zinc-cadmium efflux system outer membrane protein
MTFVFHSNLAGQSRFRPIGFVLLCLGFAFASPAQPAATNTAAPVTNLSFTTLSLAQAREWSFERNWDLLAAKSGIDAAAAQLIVAKEFPNPTASLSTAKIGTHNAGTIEGNSLWTRSYDTILAVSQLIEIGGKRKDRQMAGGAGVIGARARFFDAKRTLDQGVTKAYIAALLAGENVHVLTESAGLLRREADIAQARFKAGDLSESDRMQIEINAEQFELQAKAAEAAAVQARIAVEILLGVVQPRGAWTPAGSSLEELTKAEPPALPEPRLDANRPDVLAADADLRGARAQLQLQKAVRIPDPTLTIGGEHNPPDSGPASDTFLIGISFPLPLWNLNGGNIAAAQASVDQFAFAAGKARTQAQADIANAESEYNEAHARWTNYAVTTAPKSVKVRDSVQFAYEKGGASLVDLLNAEQTDNTVRLALVQAMSDTASAIADLVAARYLVPPSDLEGHK